MATTPSTENGSTFGPTEVRTSPSPLSIQPVIILKTNAISTSRSRPAAKKDNVFETAQQPTLNLSIFSDESDVFRTRCKVPRSPTRMPSPVQPLTDPDFDDVSGKSHSHSYRAGHIIDFPSLCTVRAA